METKIQIPESLLPMIKQIKRKYRLSTKDAFLFLMGYNTPAQKKVSFNSKEKLICRGYNTPARIRRITIISMEVA